MLHHLNKAEPILAFHQKMVTAGYAGPISYLRSQSGGRVFSGEQF